MERVYKQVYAFTYIGLRAETICKVADYNQRDQDKLQIVVQGDSALTNAVFHSYSSFTAKVSEISRRAFQPGRPLPDGCKRAAGIKFYCGLEPAKVGCKPARPRRVDKRTAKARRDFLRRGTGVRADDAFFAIGIKKTSEQSGLCCDAACGRQTRTRTAAPSAPASTRPPIPPRPRIMPVRYGCTHYNGSRCGCQARLWPRPFFQRGRAGCGFPAGADIVFAERRCTRPPARPYVCSGRYAGAAQRLNSACRESVFGPVRLPRRKPVRLPRRKFEEFFAIVRIVDSQPKRMPSRRSLSFATGLSAISRASCACPPDVSRYSRICSRRNLL